MSKQGPEDSRPNRPAAAVGGELSRVIPSNIWLKLNLVRRRILRASEYDFVRRRLRASDSTFQIKKIEEENRLL